MDKFVRYYIHIQNYLDEINNENVLFYLFGNIYETMVKHDETWWNFIVSYETKYGFILIFK